MIIGIPREIKEQEYRVGIVPQGVTTLVEDGHLVLVEQGAGEGSGIADEDFVRAGATLAPSAAEIYGRADLVMKVKEPLATEYDLLRRDQILFTYLHLAPLVQLTSVLLQKRVAAIGYETVQEADGSLPLLKPMSEVAGRLAVQMGAYFLGRTQGGRGVLLGPVTGADPGHVTILGSGTVGANAALVACGLGAEVTVLGRNRDRLQLLKSRLDNRINTLVFCVSALEQELAKADLVVGAVLVPGARTPKLISREMLGRMKKGAVLVDVAIDQGGCAETSRPTTHAEPVYVVDGVVHYCVANMPGVVPCTSTMALTRVTLPLARAIASRGLAAAAAMDPALRRGINCYGGELVNREVAQAQARQWTAIESLLGQASAGQA